MRIKLHIIVLMSLLSIGLFAQTNCLNTLREARELYEEGLIDEIADLLSGCMESGFTRSQRVEAYKLIILAYLFDDDQFAAEKMMDEFLHKFPEYEVMPNDPVEFIYLLESYKTSSVYTFNLSFGPTFSSQRVLEPYIANDFANSTTTGKTGTGFQVGVGLSRSLGKSFAGTIEFFYSTHNSSSIESSNSSVDDEIISFATITTKESLKKLDMPLSITYGFGRGNLRYSIRLGGIVSYVTASELSIVREQEGIDITVNENDMSANRLQWSYGAFGGIGFEHKVPRGFIVLDFRYNIGLVNMVISDKRYNAPRLYSRGLYIDDDFALDYLSVTIGYHFSIYQSKKSRY